MSERAQRTSPTNGTPSIPRGPHGYFDARLYAEKLKSVYEVDERQMTNKILLLGMSGTGKSSIIATAPKPIHVDSFDPGGTKSIRPFVTGGDIIANVSYEYEDKHSPSAFQSWIKEFEYLRANKYFDHIGTYVLDSSSSWMEAMMNQILKQGNRVGQTPLWNTDYTAQKNLVNLWMNRILLLPCNVIVTGHIEPFQEERKVGDDVMLVTVRYDYIAPGKCVELIPSLFDEIYITQTKNSAKGPVYYILTSNKGLFQAKTRIGRGKFNLEEENPNLKELFARALRPQKIKPDIFKLEMGDESQHPEIIPVELGEPREEPLKDGGEGGEGRGTEEGSGGGDSRGD